MVSYKFCCYQQKIYLHFSEIQDVIFKHYDVGLYSLHSTFLSLIAIILSLSGQRQDKWHGSTC